MNRIFTQRRNILFLLLMLFVTSGSIYAQTPAQKQKIRSQYDLNTLKQLEVEYTQKALAQKARVLQFAADRGWDLEKTNADGTIDQLVAVSPDGQPVYYTLFNVAAARSTRAHTMHNGGLLGLNVEGQGLTAHVWDGGATRPTHQEFDGAGGNNRVTINDGVTSLNGNSFHAQHVTGTIVASGFVANAKGMAPQARALTHDWNNDLAEATSEASSGMLVSNHSYGFRASLVPDYYFGAYIEESRDWDNLLYNSPYYLMVVAAGNDGNDNSSNAAPLNGNSSFDKLTGHSTSKNNMVVANGQDANIASDGSLTSVTINSSSSEGPTDDMRIKPDITGNGTGVYSTYDGSDSQYNSISGTSMASPNVAGSLLLLQQHYNNLNGNFMRSASLKGVALHTADDAGISGPDAVYGWGLMNTMAAAEAISGAGNTSRIEELTLANGASYSITVDADGTNPLMASISWTDPAGTANTGTTNLTTPVLVNDLDIRVTQGGSTFSPYRLTGVNSNGNGDNDVDPFERVDVNGASGSYTITVTHKGSLSSGSQNYTLIVTGVTGTPPVCNATTPAGLGSSNIGNTTATLSWNAVAGTSYDVRYRQSGTSTWTTQAVTGTSVNLTGLTANTSYQAQVRSKCPDNSTSAYSSSHSFTTNDVNCSGGTSTFPYAESFENTIGTWSQNTDDDINWTVQTGGTPSSGTGPSGASAGSYYIYMEVSGNGTGFPNKRAIITSSCFDLSAETQATATFDYQMTGTGPGTVSLEASPDNGATWTSVWTRSGDQGAAWTAASVDLSSYAGATLLLRFNGISGTTWSGDIAIDDFALTTGGGGGNPGNGCTSGIASFPYGESFENTIGAWTQNSGDDLNWTVQSGGTPSSGTGPSSASAGSYYIYMEVSGNGTGYPNKRAIITSPCFDLSGETQATASFDYQMTGTGPGTVTLEVSDDNGSSWTSAWSSTGDQGAAWNTANVNLDSYAGGSIQVRFNGISASTWSGDIAIDDFALSTSGGGGGPSQVTVSLDFVFDNYPEETTWSITNGSGGTAASGGPYGSQPDGSSLSIPVTLDAGCYTLTINDSYGDGICCGFGNGSYALVGGGTTLASGGSFGSSESSNFCVGGATQSAYTTFTQSVGQPVTFELYPNPVSGDFLTLATTRENIQYTITTMTGQLLMQGALENNQINVRGMQPGIYLIRVQDGHKSFTRKFVKQ